MIQQGIKPEAELVEILRQHPYTILPTGSTDEVDDRPEIAKLSLPSRIPFILATSNTPVIVIGSKITAAASFVERFDVGVVCEYSAASFLQAVEYVCLPENQTRMRQNAIAIANILSAEGMDSWLWHSLEKGEPCDYKFEKLLPRNRESLVPFIEPPAPQDLWREFVPTYQSLRRLKDKGFNPDFVVDVGASTGIWSHTVNKLFPQARFILLDPLMSRYDPANKKYYVDPHPNFEVVEAAVSNVPGTTHFQVSPDFYGSSLLVPNDGRNYESVEVKIVNLDWLQENKQIVGRGLLKIDVQCAEHLVLEGGKKLLAQVDVIVIELSLVRFEAEALTFREMSNLIHDLGFRYYDDAGNWREPVNGTLLQKDAVFVSKNVFVSEMHIGEF